jgi:hypothetical protein
MSEEKDSVDEAWDDVPGAEPKTAESAKTAVPSSKPPSEPAKPPSEPPKPASTPPRPASGSPPRPASNPPAQSGTPPQQASQSSSAPARETASTRPEGIAAVGTGVAPAKRTLIGIPAPVVAEKASEKPSGAASDRPLEKTSDKPVSIHDSVPAAKRTLIGIAAPVIEQKAPPAIDQKATPPEPWRASQPPKAASSQPPKAASSPPGESLPETRSDEQSAPAPPPAEELTVPSTKKALAQTTRKETPEALAAAKAQARSARGRISSAPPEAEKSSRLGPILLVAILGAGAIWFLVSKQRSMSEPVIETVPAPTPVAEQAEPEKPPESVPAPPEPAIVPTPEPLASAAPSAAPPSSASAVATAQKAPKAEPEKPVPPTEPAAPADTGAASAEGARVVTVHLTPPDAQLFYKGKSVGKSPVRIELAPGETKRSFEVGRPGFVTRRLIVDGSEATVWIGLRPETAAPAPTE